MTDNAWSSISSAPHALTLKRPAQGGSAEANANFQILASESNGQDERISAKSERAKTFELPRDPF